MTVIRTVTLSERSDGIYVNRMSSAIPGYGNSPYFNDGPSFKTLAEGMAHFEKYGYKVGKVLKGSGMVTMQVVRRAS